MGAEIEDRTPIIGIRPSSLLSRLVYLRQKVKYEVTGSQHFSVQIPTGVRDYNQYPGPGPGPSLTNRNNGHNMDVIDTTLRLGMTSGSREKLNPKHGFDEEQVGLEKLRKMFHFLVRIF